MWCLALAWVHFKAIFQTTYLVFSVYRIRICRRAFFEYFLQIKPKLRTLLSALQIIGKFFAELQISHQPVNQSKWRWHQYSIIGKGKILRNKREGNIICLAGKWCAMGWNQYWWSIRISILHIIILQEYFVRNHSHCECTKVWIF